VEFKTAEIRKKYVNKLIESLRIDDSMVDQTKEFLDSNNIKYILAPLEADPQLAYLRNANKIDAIVTEDSDLLVYKCDNILTKLDNKGDCDEYNYSDVDLGLDNYNNFVYFCILSGCDYFKMHMVGPKKAMNIVKEANEEYNKKLRFGTSQNFSELEKEILNFNSVVNAVKFEDKKNEPKGKNSKNIEVDFAKAYITFLQNLVKGENDEILNVNAKTEFINFLYKKYDLDNSFYM
jgi:5'-3' exonuclease